MEPCRTEQELGKAIKNEQDQIEIEGDLANKYLKIKATGNVAWGVCFSALAIGITLIITAAVTAPAVPLAAAESFAASATAAPVVAILGLPTAITAILIGVSAGGVGALTALRDKYKIVEKRDKYVLLEKK